MTPTHKGFLCNAEKKSVFVFEFFKLIASLFPIHLAVIYHFDIRYSMRVALFLIGVQHWMIVFSSLLSWMQIRFITEWFISCFAVCFAVVVVIEWSTSAFHYECDHIPIMLHIYRLEAEELLFFVRPLTAMLAPSVVNVLPLNDQRSFYISDSQSAQSISIRLNYSLTKYFIELSLYQHFYSSIHTHLNAFQKLHSRPCNIIINGRYTAEIAKLNV